jgi:hypothetical protein
LANGPRIVPHFRPASYFAGLRIIVGRLTGPGKNEIIQLARIRES